MEQMNNEPTSAAPPLLNKGIFSVFSYSLIYDEDLDRYVHWSKGLKMVISKDGATIELGEEEIKQLVKCLPRTFGGKY